MTTTTPSIQTAMDIPALACGLLMRSVVPSISATERGRMAYRLKREGRRDEAEKVRGEVERELLKQRAGIGKSAAKSLSWVAIQKLYPPLPKDEYDEDGGCDDDDDDLDDCDESEIEVDGDGDDDPPGNHVAAPAGDPGGPNLIRDVLWVYDNLGNGKASKRSAPGPGAWGLLQHVKKNEKNRAKFYDNTLPRVLAVQAKREEAAAERDAGGGGVGGQGAGSGGVVKDLGLDEIRRLLDSVK